jgi:D,D-heptose 1,7-bisphosphate phosphatase
MQPSVSNDMKAVFLDRDGVINELIYHQEQGIIDSPFTVEQFRLLPGVGDAIKKLHNKGYKVILVSNQPAIAKGHMSKETFDKISKKMKEGLAREGAFLDAEFYCFHHPEAKLALFKVDCECRKPKPGLLHRAAQLMGIELSQSWMIGDGLIDVKAGKNAGTKTILLARMKCELCHLMNEEEANPNALTPDLKEAVEFILNEGD